MKFKPLQWSIGEPDIAGSYLVSAPSPAGYSNWLTIGFEDDKFYPCWDLEMVGSDTLEEMQARAQAFHEAKLKSMMTQWMED